jgi:putative membrane protein
MKKLAGLLCIACVCVFIACNSGSSSQDSVDSAKNMNDSMMPDSNSMMHDTGMSAMSSAPVSKEDADWAVEIANAGMTEVELSKLAVNKATTQRLKDFANMMITDHTKAGDQLQQIAASKNIALPANLNEASQKKLDDLNKKTGKDFDKAYIDDMLGGHKKAVDKIQKGTTDLKDADLKNFATQVLPTVQMHQDSIKAIAGKK